MRAIFDYSWDLLIEPERELFQAVSVFRGGFTEEAAQDVAKSSPFLLAGLVDQGLLQVAETADGLRYQMHELTRQYAAERLANSQMATRVAANHARFFADFVAAQNESLRCDGFNMAAHTIVTELNNVNAAWNWLLQGVAEGQPSDLAVKLLPQFPPGLQYYYYLKGPLQTGKQTFLQAVTICETAGWDAQPSEHGGHYVLALCRTCAAFFALGMGEYDLVDELLGKAMGWWRQNGRADELGFALCTAGKTSLLRGQRGAAVEILHEALALMQEAGDLNGKADVLKVLGVVAVDRGHYEEAIAYYQESLALFERIDFKPGMTMVLHNIGTALFRQDKLEEARASYERALTLAKEIEYRRIVMESSGAMGGVHRVLGQHDRAERYFRRAVSMAREMGEQRITSVNLRGLGMNYLATNKLAAAESTLQEAFTIGWRTENMPEALAGMITLAQTWAQQGRVADALQLAFYVSQQQATRAIDREKNEGFLSELRQELPALMVESAERWASEQTFDTVAAWALNDETLYEI
jgi:tetratricopeptide (TPR) repeat protein